MHLGCAWYPEHWPESRWDEDLRLMRSLGMTVVRVAEFAWSAMEPSPGRYELDWLQRAIDRAHAHGLATVLCTPTATPPAWLTRQEPEILPIRDNGRRAVHGQRGHYDPCHPGYRAHAARISRVLAERFGHHPGVIGWQTDNEFWSVGYGPDSLRAFQAWLRRRYGSLDALNRAWSTRYWSQEFFAWEDIPFPGDYPNPGLLLARHRWSSDEVATFQRGMVEAIRQHSPGRFITHNFHPHDDLDRAPITDDLDFPSWDAYPDPASGRHDLWIDGFDCDRIAGLGDGRLWIMETEPGFVNWQKVSAHLAPGQMRALAWHFAGHGADAVLYWQWRSAPCNQEQFHGAICDAGGGLRPMAEELARIGREFAACAPLLAGSSVQREVLLLDRFLDRTLFRRFPLQRLNEAYDVVGHAHAHHAALRAAGCGVAVRDRLGDLSSFRLIVAPRLNHLPDADAAALADWVRAGGHLMLGARSGQKDDHGALHQHRQPGPVLAPLAGATVREFYALAEPLALDGLEGSGRWFGEWLEPEAADVEVVARWRGAHGWLDGKPACVSRRVGAGRITLLGAVPDAGLARAATRWALAASGLHVPVTPPGLELHRRRGPAGELLIAVNDGSATCTFDPGPDWRDPLGGDGGAVRLEPWAVALRHRG